MRAGHAVGFIRAMIFRGSPRHGPTACANTFAKVGSTLARDAHSEPSEILSAIGNVNAHSANPMAATMIVGQRLPLSMATIRAKKVTASHPAQKMMLPVK